MTTLANNPFISSEELCTEELYGAELMPLEADSGALNVTRIPQTRATPHASKVSALIAEYNALSPYTNSFKHERKLDSIHNKLDKMMLREESALERLKDREWDKLSKRLEKDYNTRLQTHGIAVAERIYNASEAAVLDAQDAKWDKIADALLSKYQTIDSCM